MNALERIVEAAHQLVTAADEDEYLHALSQLRDEIAAEATDTTYTNQLIGSYVA